MDEKTSNTGRVIAGAVVAATIVGAGTWWALGRDDTADATPAATITVAPSTPVGIVAGSGGTAKAADEITPIGYENTCTGAVQAATNYHVALTDPVGAPNFYETAFDLPGEPTPGKARAGLDETLAYILAGDVLAGEDPTSPLLADLARPRPWPGMVAHPEWGAYRLAACGAVRSAVDVFSCEVVASPEHAKYLGKDNTASCTTSRYTMHWTGNPADWRIESVLGQDDLLGRGVDYPEVGLNEPNPVPAERRHEQLSGLEPGWMEYANAPR